MAKKENTTSSNRTIITKFNLPTIPTHKPESLPRTRRRHRQHGARRTSEALSSITRRTGAVVRISGFGAPVLGADAGGTGKRVGGGHYRLNGEVSRDEDRCRRGGRRRDWLSYPNYSSRARESTLSQRASRAPSHWSWSLVLSFVHSSLDGLFVR